MCDKTLDSKVCTIAVTSITTCTINIYHHSGLKPHLIDPHAYIYVDYLRERKRASLMLSLERNSADPV